jgi:putative membrane protein
MVPAADRDSLEDDVMIKRITLVALATVAVTAPVGAQDAASRETREYVQAAGESDTFEMMEAYSALAESRDPEVTAFAREMIRDHGDTSRKLREATASAGLAPPPTAVGASQSPFLASLQSTRGRDFDKTYWQQQTLAHHSALIVAQRYAASGDTPSVRRAAAAAVPIIRKHLAMAEQMRSKADAGS